MPGMQPGMAYQPVIMATPGAMAGPMAPGAVSTQGGYPQIGYVPVMMNFGGQQMMMMPSVPTALPLHPGTMAAPTEPPPLIQGAPLKTKTTRTKTSGRISPPPPPPPLPPPLGMEAFDGTEGESLASLLQPLSITTDVDREGVDSIATPPTEVAGEGDLHTVIVELPMGRVRQSYTALELDSGDHVICQVVRGLEMGIVREVTLNTGGQQTASMNDGRSSALRSPRRRLQPIKIVRAACAEEVEIRDTLHARVEAKALVFVRDLIQELQVPLVVHRVHMQFDRRRMEFHYTSDQLHPDFRSLLEPLHSHFRCRIWLNNCKPRLGQPGERVESKHLEPRPCLETC